MLHNKPVYSGVAVFTHERLSLGLELSGLRRRLRLSLFDVSVESKIKF